MTLTWLTAGMETMIIHTPRKPRFDPSLVLGICGGLRSRGTGFCFEYFGTPLLVPFHQCSLIPAIHLPTTRNYPHSTVKYNPPPFTITYTHRPHTTMCLWNLVTIRHSVSTVQERMVFERLTFKRRIKSHLPFAGIIRSSPYSPRFQDKG